MVELGLADCVPAEVVPETASGIPAPNCPPESEQLVTFVQLYVRVEVSGGAICVLLEVNEHTGGGGQVAL